MSYLDDPQKVIMNVIAKYKAFGFNPPLHPDKYFVPISISEWDAVVDYVNEQVYRIYELEKEILELKKGMRNGEDR